MPQDAFTLQYVAKELKDMFVGGKISRINQPEKDVLSLLIYTRGGTVKLNFDLSAKYCRISAGESGEYANPKAAPNFCMLLRKHLQNAEICDIAQVGFERVIRFDFKCFSEFEIADMRLYVEIMGKYSNAILTKNGIICGALKTASLETGARRVTLSGAKYALPERQDKADPTDLPSLKAAFMRKDGDAAKFIADKVAGIAYTTANDIEEFYGENVTAEQLYSYINDQNYSPCVIYKDGEPYDFKARLTEGGLPEKSILSAQAKFYDYAVNKKKFTDKKRRLLSSLSSAVKKVEKRLADIADKLEECTKAEDIKLRGELITANIYAIERGMRSFEAVNYYDENGGKTVIALDPVLSPSQNAQKYYKKYAKLKRTEQNLSVQREEAAAKESYLKTIESNITLAENLSDLKETEEELISLHLMPARQTGSKKQVREAVKFRRYEMDGFIVLCGRNNMQNDELLRAISPEDTWLHAKTYHSAHVAVICNGREPTDECIKFAAEICAYYSEANGKDKAPIDYTKRKNVKKPKGANPGFVEYSAFKTILVAPNAHAEVRTDE